MHIKKYVNNKQRKSQVELEQGYRLPLISATP